MGLTVIYGENGSGKSGYARVLKRACRARDEDEQIYPNIFKSTPSGPAKAIFKLSVNGTDQEINWPSPEPFSGLLSNICVFDSKCARVIIDENNEAQYLPFGTHVFEKMVTLLKDLRTSLQKERPNPVIPEWNDIPQDTNAGKYISQLSARSNPDDISLWTESEEKLLADLSRRLTQAELDNPTKIALRLRNWASRIRLLASDLDKIENNASPEAEAKIKNNISDLITARKTLEIAPQVSLKEEPLPGVGSDVWQQLYQAARNYSIQEAYPGQEFPYTDEESRCVLCMQPLGEEAKKRFQCFRDYMEQTAIKKVEVLESQLSDITRNLSSLDISIQEKFKDVLDELRTSHDELVGKIVQYCDNMYSRIEKLSENIKAMHFYPLCTYIHSPMKELLDVANNYVIEAEKIDKTSSPEELTKLRIEKKELDAKKLLCGRKKEIETYVKQRGVSEKYDQCIIDTDFRNITNTGKRIIAESLTPELCEALQKELSLLGATHLPLNLHPSATAGEMHHKLELLNTLSINRMCLTDILSEGEQRVVGIAGFLAELKAAGHTCPIVFDDPVSSLDHRYREKIAERLVKEAALRQVIVFTHDISFLLELYSKTGGFGISKFGDRFGGVAFTAMSICRENGLVGCTKDGLPWHAKPVSNRLKELIDELNTFKSLYVTDQSAYNNHAAFLYCRLRETWEDFVEQRLFYKVVMRHDSSIKTLRLPYVTVGTNDCVAIFQGMTKCSTWMYGHDKSRSLDVNRPEPDEIEADIKALQDFNLDLKARQKQASEHYEKVINPMTSPIG